MTPRPASDEMWGQQSMSFPCKCDVLLPNGLIFEIEFPWTTNLDHVKGEVWQLAKQEDALFRRLRPASCYVFVGVTVNAKREEFYDENRRLCDLRLMRPLLNLVEPQGQVEEMIIQAQISLAIGQPVRPFDSSADPEFVDSRKSLLCVSHNVVNARHKFNTVQKLRYFLPCELDAFHGQNHVAPDRNLLFLFLLSENQPSASPDSVELELPVSLTPDEVIDYLRRQSHVPDERLILKVCGFNEYLLGNRRLYQYKYISRLVSQHKKAELVIRREVDLLSIIPDEQFLSSACIRRYLEQVSGEMSRKQRLRKDIEQQRVTSLWQTNSAFKVQIIMATYANVKDLDLVFVSVGIFHGTESLCQSQQTKSLEPRGLKWQEQLVFPIHCEDLPLSARLCLCICSTIAAAKKSLPIAIAYCNIPVFDYWDRLRSGRMSLQMWRVPKEHTGLLYPMGVTGSNPDRDALSLVIELEKSSTPVVFPPDCLIEVYAQHLIDLVRKNRHPGHKDVRISKAGTEEDRQKVRKIAKQDPLAEMTVDDKDLIWSLRNFCHDELPDSLPKLLDAAKWNSREEVAQVYFLLRSWKLVRVETALELLDCKFTDPKVRSFAVQSLDSLLEDHMLKRYLLQLVQVLVHQHYVSSDLGKFLLRRALISRDIGQFFFWLLKAETHDPLKTKVCTLYLEAYCRGMGLSLLQLTVKQIEAFEKLARVTDTLKDKKDLAAKDRLQYLKETFKRTDFEEALHFLENPLKTSALLGRLRVADCRIMDSAKRPLWLVWDNGDVSARLLKSSSVAVHEIIFKNGDDLRQDMLTLQVIGIMDSIWRSEGLDLKMLPYTCLATGKQVGLIEVVKKARTVMNVQRSQGLRAAFQVGSRELHKWFESTAKDKVTYEHVMETFAKSCAGYCVATFVLGIGDRNPDNIMINDDGQIFHIDFGHFLGHFKKKFGISRERVPFVLTDDFLFVISRGQEISDSNEHLIKFIGWCEKAYLILRKHASLLITLFTLMLSTGIPELQAPEDIEYLRTTLQVDKTNEDEALTYFKSQLNEAKMGSTYTKIDWFFHNVRR